MFHPEFSVAHLLAGCVLGFILWPGQLAAAEWETSFPADELFERLEAEEGRFLITAGDGEKHSRKAANVFAAALREAGAAFVLREEADPNEAASDQALVDAFSEKPVDRIVIVRTFEDAPSKPPRAVVTIYKSDGSSVTGFSVRKGSELGATGPSTGRKEKDEASSGREEPEGESADRRTASEGVSREAADRISEVTEESKANRKAAVETFKRKAIWFEEIVAINAQSGYANRYVQAYRGEYKDPLSGPEFYRVVGRDDLATKYKKKKAGKTVLTVAGTLAIIGGSLLMAGGLSAPVESDFASACDENGNDFIDGSQERECAENRVRREKRKNKNLLVGAAALGTLGTVGMTVGLALNPNPVPPSKRRRLADSYNKRLKERLGLGSDVSSPMPGGASEQKLDYHLSVELGPGKTGASLRVRF